MALLQNGLNGYYGFAVAAINLILATISFTPLLEWFTVFTALGYVGLLVYNMKFKAYPDE